jgi:phage gp36-like protein
MTYASRADAELQYGVTAVALACSHEGTADYGSLAQHLQTATDEIDSYLLGRYSLPLATPPSIFKTLCVDIAIYRSSLRADVRTDESRKRYEDAIAYLRAVAENKIKLKTAVDTTEVNQSQQARVVEGRTITTTYGARTFTPSNTRSVL